MATADITALAYVAGAPERPFDATLAQILAPLSVAAGYSASDGEWLAQCNDHPIKALLGLVQKYKSNGLAVTTYLDKAIEYIGDSVDWPVDATVCEIIAQNAVNDGVATSTGAFMEAMKEKPLSTLISWLPLAVPTPT